MNVKKKEDNIFGKIANLAVHRPGWVFLLLAIFVALSALTIPRLGVTTSRFELVDKSDPYQAQMMRFFERFGYPDAPVIIVRGGEPAARRAVVDQLANRLEKIEALKGRVMAQLGPDILAELLLLHRPSLLSEVHKELGQQHTLADTIEGGLPAVIATLRAKLEQGLEGEEQTAALPAEEIDEGLTKLATLASILDDYLAGKSVSSRFSELASGEDWPVEQKGIDEKGYLVGTTNQHHLIAIFPEFTSGEVSEMEPIVAQIREVRQQVIEDLELAASDIEIFVTGLPVFAVDELVLVKRGLLQSSIVTGVAIFLLLLLMFRSFRYALFVQIPLLIGTIVSLAFVYLLYQKLTIVTSSFIAVLLGLGIDFSIHILTRFNEFRREGIDRIQAIVLAARFAGPGIAVGALTTMVAFLTLATTEFTAFSELGVITAIGMVVMLLASLFVLPMLISRKWGGKIVPTSNFPGIHLLPILMRAAPKTIFVMSLLLCVGGAIALPQIDFNFRYFDFLPRNTDAAIALDILEKDGALSPTFASASAESIAEARKKTEQLRGLPTVLEVQSPSDILPELSPTELASLRHGFASISRTPDFTKLAQRSRSTAQLVKEIDALVEVFDDIRFELQKINQSTEAIETAKTAFMQLRNRVASLPENGEGTYAALEQGLARLLERAWNTGQNVALRGYYKGADLPDIFKTRFVAKDDDGVALFIFPKENIWDAQALQNFVDGLIAVDPEVTGFAVTLYKHNQMILTGFRRAAGLAFVAIVFLVWLGYRRISDTLLALIPVTAGWLWMFGGMALFDLDFNLVNIVMLPLVLGIGTDAGVHVVHRCRQSMEAHHGVAQIEELLEGTGGAVLLSALTTIVAFGGLITAEYGGMKSFGIGMVLGVGCCLLASILFLPAVLFLLGRVK